MLPVAQIERGFTFLGYWIMKQGVTAVAPSAWEAFRGRAARLYEQDGPREEILRRIGQYVRRSKRWVLSGVREPGVFYPFMRQLGDPWQYAFAHHTNPIPISMRSVVRGACFVPP